MESLRLFLPFSALLHGTQLFLLLHQLLGMLVRLARPLSSQLRLLMRTKMVVHSMRRSSRLMGMGRL